MPGYDDNELPETRSKKFANGDEYAGGWKQSVRGLLSKGVMAKLGGFCTNRTSSRSTLPAEL